MRRSLAACMAHPLAALRTSIPEEDPTVSRRRFLQAMPAALTACALPAWAQSSAKTLKLVVPFPPGGLADLFARILSAPLGELLGETVVVENRTGAGGLVGAQSVLRAPPDGQTLIVHVSSSAVYTALVRRPQPYDPVTAFEPIALLGVQPLVVAVGPSVKATTMAEFVDAARREPGKLSYATAGVGSISHVVGEMLKQRAGNLSVTHVPYRGSPPAIADVVAGRADYLVESMSSVMPFVRDGRLRVLSVLAEKPSEFLPDAPTSRAQGLDVVGSTYGLLSASPGTAPERVARIADAVRNILARPDTAAQFRKVSIEITPNVGPKEAREFLQAEVARIAPVVKAANIVATD